MAALLLPGWGSRGQSDCLRETLEQQCETKLFIHSFISMDDATAALAAALVPQTYIEQGRQALAAREKLLKTLLAQRTLPDVGWSEADIEYTLGALAAMDSNNFPAVCGVGEREGRIACPLVARRHFGFAHGVGRSGDVSAVQPKAAGSSIMYKLTNFLVLHAAKLAGLTRAKAALALPLATGMTIALTLRHMSQSRPAAKYVIWPRIDQKACMKAISTAGFEPLVIENVYDGDELRTDLDAVSAEIARVGPNSVVAIMSTSSCFAPRGCDKLQEIAEICAEHGIPHLINNAYGLQATKLTHTVNEAMRVGRVDAVVQSSDKNFMTPVGGAVLLAQDAKFIDGVSSTYAGRASASPIVDLLATLLWLGKAGWMRALAARKQQAKDMAHALAQLAEQHGERVLQSKHNPISMAMTLTSVTAGAAPTELGSMLFQRGVTGCRVVVPGSSKKVGGITIANWGASAPDEGGYRHGPYLTVAAAVGQASGDIDVFCKKFTASVKAFKKRFPPSQPVAGETSSDAACDPPAQGSAGAAAAPSSE